MTLPSILSACGKEGDLLKVKEVHDFIVRNFGFDVDAPIGKCGSLKDSEIVHKIVMVPQIYYYDSNMVVRIWSTKGASFNTDIATTYQ
ncbi:pentatricopeptide repeat-containing protein [Trifolium medium]|uniref:Pentatricopeptide repeat-containing protein n=1 Tax=Trifolium medium TaxID=97028 RepID=A0A392ME18_9FABA|nr:pentatricopeptide repeat-containing protein [Trifolium medium]